MRIWLALYVLRLAFWLSPEIREETLKYSACVGLGQSTVECSRLLVKDSD